LDIPLPSPCLSHKPRPHSRSEFPSPSPRPNEHQLRPLEWTVTRGLVPRDGTRDDVLIPRAPSRSDFHPPIQISIRSAIVQRCGAENTRNAECKAIRLVLRAGITFLGRDGLSVYDNRGGYVQPFITSSSSSRDVTSTAVPSFPTSPSVHG